MMKMVLRLQDEAIKKSGYRPEDVRAAIGKVAALYNLTESGGEYLGTGEDSRDYGLLLGFAGAVERQKWFTADWLKEWAFWEGGEAEDFLSQHRAKGGK